MEQQLDEDLRKLRQLTLELRKTLPETTLPSEHPPENPRRHPQAPFARGPAPAERPPAPPPPADARRGMPPPVLPAEMADPSVKPSPGPPQEPAIRDPRLKKRLSLSSEQPPLRQAPAPEPKPLDPADHHRGRDHRSRAPSPLRRSRSHRPTGERRRQRSTDDDDPRRARSRRSSPEPSSRRHRSRSRRSSRPPDLVEPGCSQEDEDEDEDEDSEGPWTEERAAEEQRRYRDEMARYYVELEAYERRKRERDLYFAHSTVLGPRKAVGGGLRRRDSTEEYFQRSLESVDASCAHNSRRFSIASDRSTLDEPKPPPDFQEATHKVLPVDAEQETVEAAAVLLGLGLTRPVELVSQPKAHHKQQPIKPLEDPTRAFITEILDADAQLSSSRANRPAKPPAPTSSQSLPAHAHPNPPVQKPTSGTISAVLAAHLDRPHSPNHAAISLIRLPLPTTSSSSGPGPGPGPSRTRPLDRLDSALPSRKKQKLGDPPAPAALPRPHLRDPNSGRH
ncbi:hypothetical protein PTTG_07495 [Puccinia triticina 1-1 BBBD Race 1]|uniref:Uncharacterized protein n=1 Tax=Puccinia triticina (isolate 1-1 / race 1 (BBBD)) TaxID=630390 RepID=A0A180GXE6_PUCT1|nr:hypothetical protein PTTG_07495 [Puccinia triticina 1-1 BBBD Race 1]